jgi:hypothetical protein
MLFQEKISKHWFIKPCHFDLEEDFLKTPVYPVIQRKLKEICSLKTPKAKIVRLVNVCKLVSGMITEQVQTEGSFNGKDRALFMLI